jgi:hypothetical protein
MKYIERGRVYLYMEFEDCQGILCSLSLKKKKNKEAVTDKKTPFVHRMKWSKIRKSN